MSHEPEPSSPAPAARPRLPLLSALAWLAVIIAIPMVLVAWLWHDALRECSRAMLTLHYGAFMAQSFAYHAGLAMLGVIPIALIARRRRLLIAAAVVFALGAGPDLLSVIPRKKNGGSWHELKVMSVNLMYGRGDVGSLLAQIRREKPDVLVFQEWTPRGGKALTPQLVAEFQHFAEQARDDAFGQAVFSREPFVEPVRNYPPTGSFDVPQMTCAVDFDGAPVRITNVHILPPTGRRMFAGQRDMARGLSEWLGKTDDAKGPDVLIGDFNAVARSSLLRGILPGDETYALAHDQSGFWRGSTWPRVGHLAHMPGIRLDHAIVRNSVVCTDSRTGADFGSDHRPVIVTIARPPK